LVVQSQDHLDKILKANGPELNFKKIIQYGDQPIDDNKNGLIWTWNEFMNFGSDLDLVRLEERIQSMAPNKCATLIYTSGTTGIKLN
jgi:long-chain-fatty-acid--CoA ligase ACSBG